jgi:hypothetical protein
MEGPKDCGCGCVRISPSTVAERPVDAEYLRNKKISSPPVYKPLGGLFLMKRVLLLFVFLGAAMADDCRVTSLEMEALPGVTRDRYRVYTVQMGDRIYRLKPSRWYVEMDLGAAVCRVKYDNMFVLPAKEKKELKFSIVGMKTQ